MPNVVWVSLLLVRRFASHAVPAFGCHVIAVGGTMLCGTGATGGKSDLDYLLELTLNVELKSAECIRKNKNNEYNRESLDDFGKQKLSSGER